MFHGTLTALVTPFDSQGKIDEEALRSHVERQIEAGVNGLVPAGTTGEAATLTYDEHLEVIRVTVEQAAGRVPVIAGTGSNNTTESVELTKAAKGLGADAALLISPYYNKPTQEGIYLHYRSVAEAVHLPLLIYNVPGRTASNILPATVARLAEIPNIVGIKDATGNMEQLVHSMQLSDGLMEFYSGDDASVLPFMAMGGKGVISVVSNVAPRTMCALTDAMLAGNLQAAREAQFALRELNEMMFIQSNPIPVKAACYMLGWMPNVLRLPLTPLAGEALEQLAGAMRRFDAGMERLEIVAS